jgi:methylmalonyl-CoA mutase
MGGKGGAPERALRPKDAFPAARRRGIEGAMTTATTTPAAPLALAAEFPPATETQWRAAVDAVLKGKPFDKVLVGRTADGIPVQPLYPRKAGAAPLAGRAPGIAWTIAQRADHPDPAAANGQALEDLAGGASGLVVVTRGAIGDRRGDAMVIDGLDDLDALLAGVMLDLIPLRFDAGTSAGHVAAMLAAKVERDGLDPKSLTVAFGIDPIGAFARRGTLETWEGAAAKASDAVLALRARGFAGTQLVADGRVLHDAGGSEAQELAYVLGTAVQYWRMLEAAGLTLAEAAGALSVVLSVDADQFLSTAKLRAMRKLWARLEAACGLSPLPPRPPRRDGLAHGDEGRSRGELAAHHHGGLCGRHRRGRPRRGRAVDGGHRPARRLRPAHRPQHPVDPHRGVQSPPRRRRRGRLRRHRGADRRTLPAGLGPVPGVGGGRGHRRRPLRRDVQAAVARVRADRAVAIARRREPLTGASEFPNVHEAVPEVLAPPKRETRRGAAPIDLPEAAGGARFEAQVKAFGAGAIRSALSRLKSDTIFVDPLTPIRLAEPFEAMRSELDALAATSGARSKVFLAVIGPIAAFTARAGFARNLFEAGGFHAPIPEPFADTVAIVAAFRASGAAIACLCSTDELYASEAADVATALKAAGARQLWLAGRPGDLEDSLKAAGVDGFVYAGGDVLAFLKAARAALDA